MGIDYTPEKTIKKNINAYLNYVKGMRHNFKNPDVKSFIKNIDKYAKQILLNDSIPIGDRARRLENRMQDHLKSIEQPDYGGNTKAQKCKNLKLLMRKLEPLLRLSKQERNKIIERDRKTGVQPFIPEHRTKKSTPNHSCKYYPSIISGEGIPTTCLCGMDMTYCSKNCGYATNNPLAIKAYEADTVICGGTEGAMAWKRNGKGLKIRSYQHAHLKERNIDDFRQYRYDEIERNSLTGHVGK